LEEDGLLFVSEREQLLYFAYLSLSRPVYRVQHNPMRPSWGNAWPSSFGGLTTESLIEVGS
jgi:hypothetical protein